jgi:hypothetical protein
MMNYNGGYNNGMPYYPQGNPVPQQQNNVNVKPVGAPAAAPRPNSAAPLRAPAAQQPRPATAQNNTQGVLRPANAPVKPAVVGGKPQAQQPLGTRPGGVVNPSPLIRPGQPPPQNRGVSPMAPGIPQQAVATPPPVQSIVSQITLPTISAENAKLMEKTTLAELLTKENEKVAQQVISCAENFQEKQSQISYFFSCIQKQGRC